LGDEAVKKGLLRFMKNLTNDGIIEGFRSLSTGTLGHFLIEGFLDWAIQPVYRPIHLVGTALTVSCPPTDNTVLLEAIERASPGDVLVLHRYGDLRYAPWGGILSLAAMQKGIAGAVIDGAATDWQEITELRFPVFCRNLSALTTRRQGIQGVVDIPIVCGGVIVQPGDIVLGDSDGVVVIPYSRAEKTLAQGREKERQEARLRAALLKGKNLREARESSAGEGNNRRQAP
jgi:4-hydroxy-4-methyl-2-oxoglutarate aldolase